MKNKIALLGIMFLFCFASIAGAQNIYQCQGDNSGSSSPTYAVLFSHNTGFLFHKNENTNGVKETVFFFFHINDKNEITQIPPPGLTTHYREVIADFIELTGLNLPSDHEKDLGTLALFNGALALSTTESKDKVKIWKIGLGGMKLARPEAVSEITNNKLIFKNKNEWPRLVGSNYNKATSALRFSNNKVEFKSGLKEECEQLKATERLARSEWFNSFKRLWIAPVPDLDCHQSVYLPMASEAEAFLVSLKPIFLDASDLIPYRYQYSVRFKDGVPLDPTCPDKIANNVYESSESFEYVGIVSFRKDDNDSNPFILSAPNDFVLYSVKEKCRFDNIRLERSAKYGTEFSMYNRFFREKIPFPGVSWNVEAVANVEALGDGAYYDKWRVDPQYETAYHYGTPEEKVIMRIEMMDSESIIRFAEVNLWTGVAKVVMAQDSDRPEIDSRDPDTCYPFRPLSN